MFYIAILLFPIPIIIWVDVIFYIAKVAASLRKLNFIGGSDVKVRFGEVDVFWGVVFTDRSQLLRELSISKRSTLLSPLRGLMGVSLTLTFTLKLTLIFVDWPKVGEEERELTADVTGECLIAVKISATELGDEVSFLFFRGTRGTW